jgi:phage terminase large subunit-like protein
MTVADEYHAYDISGAKIITAFRYGGRARKNNTVVIITSAGIDINSPCHEENLKAKKVLNGVINDDSYFSIIYSYDEEDSWKDKSLFIKANPSLGPILRQDILEGDLADAIATPSHQADFVAKTCGIWQQGAKSWIPLQRIEQNKDVVINPEMLTGKICTGALDLSSVNDFTVFSLCFKLSTGKYTFLHKMYIPADTLADRYAHENINFKQWIDTGLITVIPGATVDYDWVYEDIKKAYQKYRIHELSYDRWHSNEIIKKIDEEFGELPLVPLDQSLKNMSPITKSYEKEFLDGNIIENNPVTVWHLGNVVVKPTAAGDYKPLKVNAQSNQRIDSVITSIMSLSRYKVLAGKAQPARSFDEILNSF